MIELTPVGIVNVFPPDTLAPAKVTPAGQLEHETEKVVVVVAPAAFNDPSLSRMDKVIVVVEPAISDPATSCNIEYLSCPNTS